MSAPLFLSPQPFRAASSSSAGLMGLVPSPAAGEQTYVLLGDSTWAQPESISLPLQTGNAGKLLSTDGVNSYWATSVSTLTVPGAFILGTATPASSSATGVAGTITWDASYIYVCTATNVWKRAALTTW